LVQVGPIISKNVIQANFALGYRRAHLAADFTHEVPPMRLSSPHATLILGSAMLWGTAGAAAQVAPDIGSAALADGRLIVGAAALTIFFGPVRLWRELTVLSLPRLALASLAMGLFQWSFFTAAMGIGGGSATLISVSASPLLGNLMEALGKHASPPPRWWIKAAAYIMGLALFVEGFSLPLAGLVYAAYAETVSRMERQGVRAAQEWL
jgi:hypothetical protein